VRKLIKNAEPHDEDTLFGPDKLKQRSGLLIGLDKAEVFSRT
jgi:hypothetical protein